MPFTVQGVEAIITFGLADVVLANTLVGIPLMKKAGMIYNAANNSLVSGALGLTFHVKMEVPDNSNVPPVAANTMGNDAMVLATDARLTTTGATLPTKSEGVSQLLLTRALTPIQAGPDPPRRSTHSAHPTGQRQCRGTGGKH